MRQREINRDEMGTEKEREEHPRIKGICAGEDEESSGNQKGNRCKLEMEESSEGDRIIKICHENRQRTNQK